MCQVISLNVKLISWKIHDFEIMPWKVALTSDDKKGHPFYLKFGMKIMYTFALGSYIVKV